MLENTAATIESRLVVETEKFLMNPIKLEAVGRKIGEINSRGLWVEENWNVR